MEIVKKNLLSILCGVVALLAIAAYFLFVSSKREELNTQARSRMTVYSSLEQLRTKQRNMPVIGTQDTQQRQLGMFPTQPVIERAKEVLGRMKQEAHDTLQRAVEMNRHQLLVPDALPGVRERDRYNFRYAYRQRFDLLNMGERSSGASLVGLMRGGTPPSAEELKVEADRIWLEEFAPTIRVNAMGQSDEPLVRARWQEAVADLPQRLVDKAARECLVYVDRDAFDYYSNVAQGEAPPKSEEIWWAQVSLWVQEDVAKAIRRVNEGYANVTVAPVKRLIKVEPPKQFVLPGSSMSGLVAGAGPTQQRSGSMGAEYDRASEMERDRMEMERMRREREMEDRALMGGPQPGRGPVVITPQAPTGNTAASQPPAPPNPMVSPTGRFCNSMYDVLHFTVRMDVEASKVPLVLKELTRDQFVYILQANVDPLDTTVVIAQGYRYGDAPVVRLSLVCEMLLLREWTVPLMPDEIRRQVGVPTGVAVVN